MNLMTTTVVNCPNLESNEKNKQENLKNISDLVLSESKVKQEV